MARCDVVQLKCDRCRRVSLVAPTPPKVQPDFEMMFFGKRVTFQDLCERCKTTLERHVSYIEEWERELNQPFGPTLAPNVAPPVEVAPNYKPMHPHAVKK